MGKENIKQKRDWSASRQYDVDDSCGFTCANATHLSCSAQCPQRRAHVMGCFRVQRRERNMPVSRAILRLSKTQHAR